MNKKHIKANYEGKDLHNQCCQIDPFPDECFPRNMTHKLEILFGVPIQTMSHMNAKK